MSKVAATVEHVLVEGDHGPTPGVCVTCTECQHSVNAFGRGTKSVRWALAQLRRECPTAGANNVYFDFEPTTEKT
jgi:hypothetical protein